MNSKRTLWTIWFLGVATAIVATGIWWAIRGYCNIVVSLAS